MPDLMPFTPEKATPDVDTFEDACRAIRECHDRAQEALGRREKATMDFIRCKFEQGKYAHEATDLPGSEKYGEGIVKEMANRANCSSKTIYDSRAFYRDRDFDTVEELEEWMEEERQRKRGRLTWTHCRRLSQKSEPEDETPQDRRERLATDLQSRTEKREESLMDFVGFVEEVEEEFGEIPAVREAKGVASMELRTIEDNRRAMLPADPTPGRFRNEEYLDYIRSQGCLICSGPAEAAHVRTGGRSQKDHDLYTIPLCHTHHRDEWHQWGVDTFCEEYQLNPWRHVARLIGSYKANAPLD